MSGEFDRHTAAVPALAFKVVSCLCQQGLKHSKLKGRGRLRRNGSTDGLSYVHCVFQAPAGTHAAAHILSHDSWHKLEGQVLWQNREVTLPCSLSKAAATAAAAAEQEQEMKEDNKEERVGTAGFPDAALVTLCQQHASVAHVTVCTMSMLNPGVLGIPSLILMVASHTLSSMACLHTSPKRVCPL